MHVVRTLLRTLMITGVLVGPSWLGPDAGSGPMAIAQDEGVGRGRPEKESEPRVTFEFDNADVRVVVKAIAQITGMNVVMGPDVVGTVTMSLRDVPGRDALHATVETLGYTVVEDDGGVLRITEE